MDGAVVPPVSTEEPPFPASDQASIAMPLPPSAGRAAWQLPALKSDLGASLKSGALRKIRVPEDGASYRGPNGGFEQHPFDRPHLVLQELRTELSELRASAESDRKRCTMDIQLLRRELSALRESVAVERAERANDVQRLAAKVEQDRAALSSEARGFHAEALAQLAQQQKAASLECALLRDALAVAARDVAAERTERAEETKILSERLDANFEGDGDFNHMIENKIEENRQAHVGLAEQLRNCESVLRQLRSSTEDLHGALSSERAVRVEEVQALRDTLKSHSETQDKTINDFRVTTANAMSRHKQNYAEELRMVQIQFSDLSKLVDAEKLQWREKLQELEPQIDANNAGIKRNLAKIETLTSAKLANPTSVRAVSRGDFSIARGSA